MNEQAGPPANHKSIFWISALALFTAATANAIRVGASGAIKKELFDPIAPAHSGEMIASTLGNAFLGFALSLLVISPLLDRIGAKRVILFASACFIVGPALILMAPTMHGVSLVYGVLTAGMVISGFGWGATEGSINPLAATIYPDDKTGKLNSLHAWWPFGLIVGGLLSAGLVSQLGVNWRVLIALIMVPGLIFGLWALRHTFPQTESTAKGVSFNQMLAEPFKRPSFWIFFGIMFLTASTELGPGAWVDVALSQTVGMPGILVLVYVAAIMFVMRHFAGALEHRFSDMGLLCLCTAPAAIGLYLLSTANSPFSALFAASLWAIGVCFTWPTMLAAAARRYPDGGSWTIGLLGFAGAMAIYFVLPQIGKIYDAAKLKAAGGAAAFESLQPGPEMNRVLGFAARESFQMIALIAVALFFIFGAVWLFERRNRKG
ncbi:MAG: MFS transporter [Novosphingobium sp.]